MEGFGSIGFLSPLLLAALIALPILYWLLRATPPAPIKRLFPAVVLLLGLKDEENTPDKTPWWLLLLRLLAVAAIIVGFAGPVLNPQERVKGQGNLVLALDGSWASAQHWDVHVKKAQEILRRSTIDDRVVSFVNFSATPFDGDLPFFPASEWNAQLQSLQPSAWAPDYSIWLEKLKDQNIDQFIWISDGVDGKGRSELAAALPDLTVIESNEPILGLAPLKFEDGLLSTEVQSVHSEDTDVRVDLIGDDLAGQKRVLATQSINLSNVRKLEFDLPTELRNRIQQARIKGLNSAGSVSVADDSVQSKKIALLAGAQSQEAGSLLSSLHYVRSALATNSTLIEADLETMLVSNPDIMIFADVGQLTETETENVLGWVKDGGVLVRFAGSRLIGSDLGKREEHPLLPVRLRLGGRDVSGAMSWGEPKKIREFSDDSPFKGLNVPDDVSVNVQVLAQPDPNLSDKVLASLLDGTPLVTAKDQGDGRVVLFHVTANAEWSNLPLSGLFVKMLERLSISSRRKAQTNEELAGLTWKPLRLLDGFGQLVDAENLPGVAGDELARGFVSEGQQPGIYGNQEKRTALNVISEETELSVAKWPIGTRIDDLGVVEEKELKPYFLTAALLFLLIDILATLGATGLLVARTAVFVFALMFAGSVDAQNTSDDELRIIEAANNTVLAYVLTGDKKLDETSRAGLLGLSAELFRRTAIEPIAPIGVDLDDDELSLYPFLYWPMSVGQIPPSPKATTKLNRFLRSGGMIMFDTRDSNISRSIGNSTKHGRKLQEIASRLDIPPLEPIPTDHVLTRSFYLLQDFPGRFANAPVWVEESPDAEEVEGLPFRNLNDGVTPVLIGGNDWAAAWAIDERGRFMFPVGRGSTGEFQREYAQRFGVNLIMHVLTGNYKSDQVHVPALLDRLGQ